MPFMTYRQLLDKLTELAIDRDDNTMNEVVTVRLEDEDGDLVVGGITDIIIDPGCTEQDGLVIDGGVTEDGE